MGYPMTYGRLLALNHLAGNYTKVRMLHGGELGTSEPVASWLKMIAGDMRRLESDTRDGGVECQRIATEAGVDVMTVRRVLDALFRESPQIPPHDEVRLPVNTHEERK
jgi:hypothetical protein